MIAKDEVTNFQWWKAENPGDVSMRLMAYCEDWDNRYSNISQQHMRHLRLYSNREVVKLTMAQHQLAMINDRQPGGNALSSAVSRGRITLNIVKSCVDTLMNKIGKNRTRPMFLTTGGIVEQQTRAKQMNQFCYGALENGGAYKTGKLAFRDGLIFGDGFAKIVNDDGKRCVEKVMPDEILVDPIDGYYGTPNVMVQRRFVSRESLMDAYPEHKEKLAMVPSALTSGVLGNTDAVVAAEAWKLKSGTRVGRHVVCVKGITLVDEEFEATKFPIRRFSYTPSVCGYWSQGIAEELTGIQIEINRLLMHIQESMRRLSNPRVYLQHGSKVLPTHVTNTIADIVYYTGERPVIEAAATVHPEIFAQLAQLKADAFEIVGISRLSAQSQKPPGLNSGVALDNYADIETERFATTSQAYDDFILECADAIIDDMEREGDNAEVSVASRDHGLKKLTWGKIKLPRDNYLLQCFPASAFPRSPAGRLNMLAFMSEKGMIQPDEMRQLMDMPDIEASNRDKISPLLLAFTIAETALFQGRLITPDPYMDIQIVRRIARGMYSWASGLEEGDIPEENMELLRKVIDTVNAVEADAARKKQAETTPPPAALAAMAAGQGLPAGKGMVALPPAPGMA